MKITQYYVSSRTMWTMIGTVSQTWPRDLRRNCHLAWRGFHANKYYFINTWSILHFHNIFWSSRCCLLLIYNPFSSFSSSFSSTSPKIYYFNPYSFLNVPYLTCSNQAFQIYASYILPYLDLLGLSSQRYYRKRIISWKDTNKLWMRSY